jgi:hypothetical protein
MDPVPECLRAFYQIILPLKLFSLSMEGRRRKLCDVLPLAKEVLREYQTLSAYHRGNEEVEILDLLTAHFIARLRTNAFEDVVTAWAMRHDGRERIRVEENVGLTRVNVAGRLEFEPLEYVTDMKTALQERRSPWDSPVSDDGIDESATDDLPDETLSDGSAPIDFEAETFSEACEDDGPAFEGPPEPDPRRATPVAQQRHDFDQALKRQLGLTLSERLAVRLEDGAWIVAFSRVREMAAELQMAPDRVEKKFRCRMFKGIVPDTLTDEDIHWRTVHALGDKWKDLGRIGVRSASMATSEAEVERLLSVQKTVQGIHGVHFGTATLDARLFLRYEH